MKISAAIETISKALKEDPDYAWGWQSNLAMTSYDEGLDHGAANRAAAHFLKLAFNFDITTSDLYKETQ